MLEQLVVLKDKTSNPESRDNVISAMFRIMTFNFNEEIYAQLASSLFSEVPFMHDLNENETIAKCSMLLMVNRPDLVKEHALTIFKTCLFAVIEKESYSHTADRR